MSGVVIGVGAVVGGVIGGGGTLIGIGKENKSLIKAFKQQMEYVQRNYNYNQAALDKQERSMYDSAVSELFNMSINAYQNNAQVEASMAETGVEGRTQDKISQAISGQISRQKTAVKENYEVGVWDIRGQKEALYITTKAEVEQARNQLKSQFTSGFNAFTQVLNGAAQGAAIGAATAGVGMAAAGAFSGTAATGMGAGAAAQTAGETAGQVAGQTAGQSTGFFSTAMKNYASFEKYIKPYQSFAKGMSTFSSMYGGGRSRRYY